MSQFRRLVFVVVIIVQIAGYILIMDQIGEPVFDIAYSFSFMTGQWKTVLDQYEFLAYSLIVPIFILNALIYLWIGGHQEEKQRQLESRRYY